MESDLESLAGACEVASGVFVFTSGAYALNSGVILGGESSAGAKAASESEPRPARSGGPGSEPGGALPPALLVDPGYFPGDLDRIAALLEVRGRRAARIVLTHSDWDHVAGTASFPGAGIVVSSHYPGRVREQRQRIVRSLEEFDRKLYVQREPAFSIPEPDSLVGSPADIVWEGPGARAFPAGGHTTDGLILLLRESRILFVGDHLSDLEIPFVGDSVAAYEETLGMARNLLGRGEVETLVPGHGRVCDRAGIKERIEEDADYLVRLESWVRETRRTVDTLEGFLERCDEVVFRKGWGNPDVHAEHRGNVTLIVRALGIGP